MFRIEFTVLELPLDSHINGLQFLGHRQLSSTQIYLHLTAEDLRKTAEKHPVNGLVEKLENFLPNMKLPFQYPLSARRKGVIANAN